MRPPAAWWKPAVHEGRRPALILRSRLLGRLRSLFDEWVFLEVEPAILQVSPGNETHLHAFSTTAVGTDLARQTLYLHTSPEFACKKLLAAGEQRIVAIAPVFRNRERGPLHHPQFTMLEWYRAHEGVGALLTDIGAILVEAVSVSGRRTWSWGGRDCEAGETPELVTVDEAFATYAGLDLRSTYGPGWTDRDGLAAVARGRGLSVADDETWSDLFSRLLAAFVEPRLGVGRPTFLTRYPACEAALASLNADDPAVADRFELYVCGLELANGFAELTDPAEQRRRFEQQMSDKERIYGERYPIDEEFLAALAAMPPAAGVALGFDRLVMLAAGAQRLDQVVWTPVAEPSVAGPAGDR